jgi:hypothetical protein
VTTIRSNTVNRAPTPTDGVQASSQEPVRCAVGAPAILLGMAAIGMLALIPLIPQTGPRARTAATLAQDNSDGDTTAEKGASPEQIEKYVAVYRAMQRNHSMTVEQAAAAQGMTVSAFRQLEQSISSDDLSRDAARRALAAPAPSATPTPKASH